jgi:hypothetical protein
MGTPELLILMVLAVPVILVGAILALVVAANLHYRNPQSVSSSRSQIA